MTIRIGLLLHATVVLHFSASAALVGRWEGDGNATDSVAANNGALFGDASFIPGVYGQAFGFGDGGGGYVSIPSVPAYQFGTGDFSVAFWATFDSFQNNGDGFLHKDTHGFSSPTTGWLFNVCDLLGGVGMEVRNFGAGQDVNARIPAASFMVDSWYHFVGLREGTSVRLYIDGDLVASTASALPINVDNNHPLEFGALSALDRQYFNGAVDDVRLYNHALSQEEINVLAVPEPSTVVAMIGLGLLAFWRRRTAGAA